MFKIIRFFYTVWGVFWFWGIFLLLYPAFMVAMFSKRHRHWAQPLNRIWAIVVYFCVFLPVKREWRFKREKGKPYIYCPNHTSYLDIPLIGLAGKGYILFMGKESLSKIPFFGWMFKRIHIPVNRGSLRGRYKAYEKCKEVLDQNFSLLMFPEGTINEKPPRPMRFKEGAFRLAIEKQVPIVPVTIPYHWIVLHGTSSLLKWHRVKIIFHEPIETTGLTMNDVPKVMQQVYEVIDQEMQAHFPQLYASSGKPELAEKPAGGGETP